MRRTVVAVMEIIINQSVDVKRTVDRSTIYLLTKFHKSRLSLIVQVNVVLNRTVVVDSD